jgi:hypothetical protein
MAKTPLAEQGTGAVLEQFMAADGAVAAASGA